MGVILLLWLLGPAAPSGPPPSPLLVSAAVSLTEALEECGAAFTAATGIRVTFNFGASNMLARQILQGAPVDVFVSADRAQMDLAARAGAVEASSIQIVARNHLVIIAPGDSARRWHSSAPLATDAVKRIAVGETTAVPAGVYAKAWLQRTGLWGAVEPKLVPAASVRGALAAVRTGAADAGIVYATDARSVGGTTVVFEVTGRDAPSVEYPAGVVASSNRAPGGRAFVEFLRGPVAQQILTRRGFDPLKAVETR